MPFIILLSIICREPKMFIMYYYTISILYVNIVKTF